MGFGDGDGEGMVRSVALEEADFQLPEVYREDAETPRKESHEDVRRIDAEDEEEETEDDDVEEDVDEVDAIEERDADILTLVP